jgi:hypothetical protein
MHKKIIALFLMAVFSIIVLPSMANAAVEETSNLVKTNTPAAALFLQNWRSRNRRWGNRRMRNRGYIWSRSRSNRNNRWNDNRWNRRDRRRDRREDRRDRREDRRDRREDRRDRRN